MCGILPPRVEKWLWSPAWVHDRVDMRVYCVYIMASRSRVLYTGVTNDLARRVNEHKLGRASFTSRYRITRLVYFEEFTDIREAIAHDRQIKDWTRARRVELIEARNPNWEDLADEWARTLLPPDSLF